MISTALTRFSVPAILVFYIFILYGPVLLIPVFSFSDNIYMSFPIQNLTVRWYGEMLGEQRMLASLWVSIKIAIGVAIVSTVFGFMSAKAMTKYDLKGKGYVLGFVMIPLVVPTIILGASLLSFFRQFLHVELSVWTVALSHTLISIPFSLLVIYARLEGFDRALEEASADLGMNAWQTFHRVTLPLAMPGVLASLLLSIMVSFDEFALAFFLSSNEPTLPVYMYGLLRFPEHLPTILALGSCILIVSVVIISIAEWLRRGTS